MAPRGLAGCNWKPSFLNIRIHLCSPLASRGGGVCPHHRILRQPNRSLPMKAAGVPQMGSFSVVLSSANEFILWELEPRRQAGNCNPRGCRGPSLSCVGFPHYIFLETSDQWQETPRSPVLQIQQLRSSGRGGEMVWNGSFFILTNLIATSQQFAILVESAAFKG